MPRPLRPRRSAIWSIIWRVLYGLIRIVDPLLRSWIANGLPGFDGVVELRFVGRRSGRPRRMLVTLLSHGGRWYVGHPNGPTDWQRNIEATGWVDVEPPGAGGPRFAVTRLGPGPERDAVIRATATQQFFPADVVYRAAQRHIAAVGTYHRLEPISGGSVPSQPAAPQPEGVR
ncbi:MAG TPA: hypothetical protein VM427_00915 [Patescibacteria group bacterium]|nr:hypothetical protein [Patescibacteria group bacterium]